MINYKILKDYIIGIIIGISFLFGISYASTNTIGGLFEKIGGSWKLVGTNIKDGTISNIQMGDNTVTTGKILDKNVTESKLSDGVVVKLNSPVITETDPISVKLLGNQTIGGVKTFANPIVGVNPTLNNHLITKQYVDSSINSFLSCDFNGTTISNGSSVTAYLTSSVAYGNTCTSQTRTCTNGNLNGSYIYSSCSITYTYSWGSGTWGSCSVSCGGGTQYRSVSCVRSDGITVADSNCSGIKPSISQSCNTGLCSINGVCGNSRGACNAGTLNWINNTSTCGSDSTWTCNGENGGSNSSVCSYNNGACVPTTCPGGSDSTTSPNGLVTCSATRPSASIGQSVFPSITNGGTLSGTCQLNGTWSYTFTCPNPSTPIPCVGGGNSYILSADGSRICSATWPQAYPGETISVYGTNGLNGSATCTASGWNFSYTCPNAVVVSCPAGGTNWGNCYFTWNSANAGQAGSIVLTSGQGSSGSFSAICGSTGSWQTNGTPVCNTQHASCGSSANSCNVGTPTGYSAGSCGGYATWTCQGISGGNNASCSSANSACCSDVLVQSASCASYGLNGTYGYLYRNTCTGVETLIHYCY